MFWKNEKTQVNSAEYEKLYKKLLEISASVEELTLKYKILSTNYDNLRGNFSRKLRGLKEEEKEEEEQQKDINNPVILPYNGTFK